MHTSTGSPQVVPPSLPQSGNRAFCYLIWLIYDLFTLNWSMPLKQGSSCQNISYIIYKDNLSDTKGDENCLSKNSSYCKLFLNSSMKLEINFWSPEIGQYCKLPHLSCYSSEEHTLMLLMVLISKRNVSSNSVSSLDTTDEHRQVHHLILIKHLMSTWLLNKHYGDFREYKKDRIIAPWESATWKDLIQVCSVQ